MAEVFAGFICGYGLALLVTPLAAIAVVRARVSSPTLQRVAPEGTNLVALSVILHTFAFFALTAVGMLLGLLLYGLENRRPAGGLGSPNALYTAVVLVIAGMALAPLAVALPRLRVALLAVGLAFALTFGWLVPYLSLIGPGEA
jgi:hypothetical protein